MYNNNDYYSNDYNSESGNNVYFSSYDNNGFSRDIVSYEPKKKKRPDFKKIMAVALAIALVFGCAGIGAALKGRNKDSSESTVISESTGTKSVDVSYVSSSGTMTAAEVYAANVNSTVGISVSVDSMGFFGYQYSSSGAGSGFIITSDGYIVTNYHVIEDADRVSVTLYDDSVYDAQIIGYDENNDIAVIKIEAENLTPVTLGDSDSASVGSDVVAIGNPLGELTFTLTKGIISALDREVEMSNGIVMDLIQTDCAINSGNSGGALFNMQGEVIGITNAKYSSSSGGASIDNIAFAIPINSVKDIITKIIETGYKSNSSSDYTEEYIYPNYGFGYGSGGFGSGHGSF